MGNILPVTGNSYNQPWRISATGYMSENSHMEIADFRRKNLKRVIDERYGGVSSRFAKQYEMPAPNVSQLISGKRSFGNELARRIEEAEGLRIGWLDEEVPLTDQAIRFARMFMELSDIDQAKLVMRLEELRLVEQAQNSLLLIQHPESTRLGHKKAS